AMTCCNLPVRPCRIGRLHGDGSRAAGSADRAAGPISARRHPGSPREEAREVGRIAEAERIRDLAHGLARMEQLTLRLEQDAAVHELDRRLLRDRKACLAQLRL